MIRNSKSILTGLAVLLVACQASQSEVQSDTSARSESLHADWAGLLEKFHQDGGLNYAALTKEPSLLNSYLAALSNQTVSGWPQEELTAFWINAYNAVAAKYVVERYPQLDSVKEVDGIFDELTSLIAGEQLTLDAIEGRARSLGDPRVHFAVVCASESCPDLQPLPFEGATLEQQFRDATDAFLENRDKGLRFEESTDTLWLSSIFKWYAGDFTGGSTVLAFVARGGILDWVLAQLPEDEAQKLKARKPKVRYLDYDWSLNDRPRVD